jgi:hypothetical protein
VSAVLSCGVEVVVSSLAEGVTLLSSTATLFTADSWGVNSSIDLLCYYG